MKISSIEYIDLDLPSGTLWAKENADNKYYTCSEAINKFKNHLPTATQFMELLDYTKYKYDSINKGI